MDNYGVKCRIVDGFQHRVVFLLLEDDGVGLGSDNSDLSSDGLGSQRVITCYHDNTDSSGLTVGDGFGDTRSWRINHSHHADVRETTVHWEVAVLRFGFSSQSGVVHLKVGAALNDTNISGKL